MHRDDIIKQMKEEVFQANLDLVKHHLVKLTWGNVSAMNRELDVVVIKPSGVPYETMKAGDMVVTDIKGKPLEEGGFKPSSDLKTHLYLYEHFHKITSVIHTHAKWSVIWASVGQDIPIFNTTHADAFYGPVPCARDLKKEEIEDDYEYQTGVLIVNTFHERGLDYHEVPSIILSHHGPFSWGSSIEEALQNAITLDEVADIAYHVKTLDANVQDIPDAVKEKHYTRKHGKHAYYGQTK